jgi:hypothetical protein
MTGEVSRVRSFMEALGIAADSVKADRVQMLDTG